MSTVAAGPISLISQSPTLFPPAEPVKIAAHGPYEDAIIEIVGLFRDIVRSQPEPVKAELWKMFVEDIKAWREFWKALGK